jgi:hypothetical protein
MSDTTNERPPDKAGKTLIKAFTFAGAIVGVGLYGLARTVVLFGRELDWISGTPEFGSALWWILCGAGLGFMAAWILVKTRRRF